MVKRKKHDGLSRAELGLIARLLEEAVKDLHENDPYGYVVYKIDATEGNKQVILDMMEKDEDIGSKQNNVEEILFSKDEIETCEWELAKYLSNRCRKLSEKS